MSEISGTGKLDSRPFPLTLSFTAAPKNDGPSKARRVNGRTVQRSTVWSWKKMGGSENGKENEANMRVMVLRYPKKQILHPWSLTWDLKINGLGKGDEPNLETLILGFHVHQLGVYCVYQIRGWNLTLLFQVEFSQEFSPRLISLADWLVQLEFFPFAMINLVTN